MPNADKMPRNAAGRAGLFGAEVTDAEKATRQVASAMDSVNLINDLIAAGDRAEQKLDTIRRNVEHLKIVVARDVVKNSTEDLAPLNAAAAAGDAFLAAGA
jgi:hypothetical protein